MSQFVGGPIYAYATDKTGTIHYSPSSGKFALLKKDGTSQISQTNITDNDSGELETVRVWYVIDASAIPAGFYDAVFKFGVVGTSDGILHSNKAVIPFNLYWNDPVNMAISSLLSMDQSEVVTSDLDNWIVLWYYRLMALYPGNGLDIPALPDYSALTLWQDKQAIDNALAFLAAASYRPGSPIKMPRGSIVSYQSGTDKTQWANVDDSKQLPLEEQWINEAWAELARVSFIALADNASASPQNSPILALAGPRRSARTILGVGDASALYSLYADDLYRYGFVDR